MIIPNKLRGVLLLIFVMTVHMSSLCQASEELEVYVTVHENCSGMNNAASGIAGGAVCVELDDALASLQSEKTLLLLPGVHTVYNSTIVRDLTNISIIGSAEDKVIITCKRGHGLAFNNITGLFMSNIAITNCGLSGEPLAEIATIIREQIDFFVTIPTTIQVAIFMGLCEDVSMANVTVANTTGIGLVGVNILGLSTFFGMDFRYNQYISRSCDYPSAENFGGGAYFFYGDSVHSKVVAHSATSDNHNLIVADSHFHFNSDCTFAANTEANYHYIVASGFDASYFIGGGLTVFVAQIGFPLNVSVVSSNFYGNRARFGGGAHVGLFSGIEQTHIHFIDCIFDSNEGESAEISNGGAGLAVFTGLFNPLYDDSIIIGENTRVIITNTLFLRNNATKGAGLFTFSLFNGQRTLVDYINLETFSVLFVIQNCTFAKNIGLYGAGLSLQQRIDYGYNGKVFAVLTNVTISSNRHTGAGSGSLFGNTDSSAMHLESVPAIFFDKLDIRDNAFTGLHILSSVVVVSDTAKVTFVRNSGLLGGAMHLAGIIPVLAVIANATILFKENHATLQGGAIYVTPRVISADDILLPINDECFYLPLPSRTCVGEECNVLIGLNIHISFQGNVAPLGGAVYGSTLESCAWARTVGRIRDQIAPNLNILEFLAVFYPESLDFEQELNSSSTVSTVPSVIKVTAIEVELMPGQLTYLTIFILDDYNNNIPAVVSSLVSSNSNNISKAVSTLGESGYWFADTNTHDATFEITGIENTHVNVTFFTTDTVATTTLSFKLNSCPLGIIYDPIVFSCKCDPRVNSRGIDCDAHTFNITIPNNIWIGTAVENNTNDDDLIVHQCRSSCEQGSRPFTTDNLNSQCSEKLGRAGILCGGCASGKSATFGSLKCQQCSNLYLLLIPIFAIAGVLFFVAIALLEFTINNGWINIVLFYCNILSIYGNVLSARYDVDGLFVPPSLLSLQIGTGLCFYDGMTAITRAGLQFIFPLYLYLLIIVFIFLCRRYSYLSERFSPASTFVTLTLMSYVSTLSSCADILGGVVLETLRGKTTLHWQVDPNQRYFKGIHSVLVVIASLLMLIYIIPFPIMMLFPTLLYRCLKRFKPFYDALWAPFKIKFRFWLGLRMIALIFLFTLPKLFEESYILLSIAFLFVLQYIQLVVKPFESLRVNYVDNFLALTVTILLLGTQYKEFYGSLYASKVQLAAEYLLLIFVVGAGYMLVVIIFYILLSQKFEFMKPSLISCFSCFQRHPQKNNTVVTHSEVALDEIHRSPTQNSMHLNFEAEDNVAELRESLLET